MYVLTGGRPNEQVGRVGFREFLPTPSYDRCLVIHHENVYEKPNYNENNHQQAQQNSEIHQY